MYNETRFKMVEKMNAKDAQEFLKTATFHTEEMYKRYKNLVNIDK
jgi:cytidylate kinase